MISEIKFSFLNVGVEARKKNASNGYHDDSDGGSIKHDQNVSKLNIDGAW